MRRLNTWFRYLFILVAIAIVAGSLSYAMVRVGFNKASDGHKIREQQNYINTKKRIENETKGVGAIQPDVAREWLLNRQQSSSE